MTDAEVLSNISQEHVQRVAVKVVIRVGKAVLCLHPSEIDLNRKWQIPGGIRDEIKEPLKKTGAREVFEETGLTIAEDEMRLLRLGEWSAVDKGERVRILAIFFEVVLPEKPEIVLSEEHDGYAWLTPDNHTEFDANPEVHEIVSGIS